MAGQLFPGFMNEGVSDFLVNRARTARDTTQYNEQQEQYNLQKQLQAKQIAEQQYDKSGYDKYVASHTDPQSGLYFTQQVPFGPTWKQQAMALAQKHGYDPQTDYQEPQDTSGAKAMQALLKRPEWADALPELAKRGARYGIDPEHMTLAQASMLAGAQPTGEPAIDLRSASERNTAANIQAKAPLVQSQVGLNTARTAEVKEKTFQEIQMGPIKVKLATAQIGAIATRLNNEAKRIAIAKQNAGTAAGNLAERVANDALVETQRQYSRQKGNAASDSKHWQEIGKIGMLVTAKQPATIKDASGNQVPNPNAGQPYITPTAASIQMGRATAEYEALTPKAKVDDVLKNTKGTPLASKIAAYRMKGVPDEAIFSSDEVQAAVKAVWQKRIANLRK